MESYVLSERKKDIFFIKLDFFLNKLNKVCTFLQNQAFKYVLHTFCKHEEISATYFKNHYFEKHYFIS